MEDKVLITTNTIIECECALIEIIGIHFYSFLKFRKTVATFGQIEGLGSFLWNYLHLRSLIKINLAKNKC